MTYPHRIRLRGPWQVQPLHGLDVSQPLPAALTMRMPGRLSDTPLHDFRGRLRFRRRFGYPGRIDIWECVWLTFAGIEGQASVGLNGQKLGELGGPGDFDVTRLLQIRNEVTVELQCTAPTCGLSGEVALEVRATAFLQHVRFVVTGDCLQAHGIVVGKAERPLDLYLLAGNHCKEYKHIIATESGQPFTLQTQLPSSVEDTVLPVRVELVDGGTVWYFVDGTVKGQTTTGDASS
jgi:hypothetical protein